MKKQILSLIFVIISSIGFSQIATYPMLTSSSNPTLHIAIHNMDTLSVPVGDSVWISGINSWCVCAPGVILELNDKTIWSSPIYIGTVVTSGSGGTFAFAYTYTSVANYQITKPVDDPGFWHNFSIKPAITTTITTGIATQDLTKSNLKAYPNPASDQLNISGLLNSQKLISITNVIGEVVKTFEADVSESLAIDIKNLSPGVYFIVSNNKALKFIKE